MRAALGGVALLAAVLGIPMTAIAQSGAHQIHLQQNPPTPTPPASGAAHTHPPPAEGSPDVASDLPGFIPPLTDDDRRAAFPDVDGHTVHGNGLNYLVLFDQFEWQHGNGPGRIDVDVRGWIGRDRDRLWFRSEGGGTSGGMDDTQTHAFYGRQVSRWWDLVAGIRQDTSPGGPQTWAAIGVQGLAPYWFDVEVTAYLGTAGRTQIRLEGEYDLLITNRLILQPLIEAQIVGKADPPRGIAAGVTTDAGLRLRYEWRREVAPYAGITWGRRWGGAARLADTVGDASGNARLVTGLRVWF